MKIRLKIFLRGKSKPIERGMFMKKNNAKMIANRTKLFSAVGMFAVSAAMLASSTLQALTV